MQKHWNQNQSLDSRQVISCLLPIQKDEVHEAHSCHIQRLQQRHYKSGHYYYHSFH